MSSVEVILHDGARLTFRPIRPEDEPAMVRFHRTLSDRSVYLRYFHQISLDERVAHERLAGVCFSDRERIVLVAETRDKDKEIVGVGRLMCGEAASAGAEFAVIVSDAWQDRGVGSALLERLIVMAREEGLSRLTGYSSWWRSPIVRSTRDISSVLKPLADTLTEYAPAVRNGTT